MFFSVKTTNLYWEIFTKDLVAFKRWDSLRMILWGFTENPIFSRRGVTKPNTYRNCPKREKSWKGCRFKGGFEYIFKHIICEHLAY